MKKIILSAAVAALFTTGAFAADKTCATVNLTDPDAKCVTAIKKIDLNVTAVAENANYYNADLILQSRVIKKLSPKFFAEVKKFRKMVEIATTATDSTDEVKALLKKYSTEGELIIKAAIENKGYSMGLMDKANDPFARLEALNAKNITLTTKLETAVDSIANLKIDHANDMANAKTARDESIADLRAEHVKDIANVQATLKGLGASSHSGAIYNIVKGDWAWLDFNLKATGVTYTCSKGLSRLTDKQKSRSPHKNYIGGGCLKYVGQIEGEHQFGLSLLYTSDDSSAMTMIDTPNTFSERDLVNELKFYNASRQTLLGYKNGAAYQSGVSFVNGHKIITNDRNTYDNLPVVKKAKTKTRVQAFVVPDIKQVVVPTAQKEIIHKVHVVKDTSSYWD